MPLPWKKSKGNRISRIVADLQPPPRSASLVVETGFPTSIVDLLVKNRHRIRRQSSAKNATAASDNFDPHSLPPPPSPFVLLDTSPVSSADAPRGRVVDSNSSVQAQVLCDPAKGSAALGGGAANAGDVFVAAMKMFLVLVLALSTKKLAVGITLSAFLLFLLEFFGKFAVGFFKPCSDAQAGMSSWIRRIFQRASPERRNRQGTAVKRLERRREWREKDHIMSDELRYVGEECNPSSREIQTLEPDFTTSGSGAENQSAGESVRLRRSCLSRERRWGSPDADAAAEENEEEEGGKLRAAKNIRSRSAKLRAKIIKKLIPKKLRSVKKMKVSDESRSGSRWRNDGGSEQDEREKEEETVWSGEGEEEDEEEDGDGGSSVQESWHSAEMGAVEEEGNNGGVAECAAMAVMILSGLVGGRFVAVMVTVSGCFIFKFIKIRTSSAAELSWVKCT